MYDVNCSCFVRKWIAVRDTRGNAMVTTRTKFSNAFEGAPSMARHESTDLSPVCVIATATVDGVVMRLITVTHTR